jgi:two-component system CheB/CheR fusion protein
MPPAVLVNDRHELLHIFGGAEKYLQVRSGRPSADALDFFTGELRTTILGALQKAQRDNSPLRYNGVRVRAGTVEESVRVSVEPVYNPRSTARQMLVTIEPMERELLSDVDTIKDTHAREASRDRIASLEDELTFAKENLQATVEELETSNEELQATNEELVASNEELQSTNEELHSVNEELYTVNAEYQKKINDLTAMTSDLDSLIENTDVATIFLDAELRIRKFTPQIVSVFRLLQQDVGRSIDSFAHHLEYPSLTDDMRRVLSSGEPLNAEVQNREGRWMLLRLSPYRNKKQIEGVVLTLIDIEALCREGERSAPSGRGTGRRRCLRCRLGERGHAAYTPGSCHRTAHRPPQELHPRVDEGGRRVQSSHPFGRRCQRARGGASRGCASLPAAVDRLLGRPWSRARRRSDAAGNQRVARRCCRHSCCERD